MVNFLRSAWAKLATFILAYFAPIKEIVICLLIFLVVDFISGVWAASKEGSKIESKKMRKTVIKLVWYSLAVMLAHIMEVSFKIGWSEIASITGGFICLVELKSIFENIARITNEPIFNRLIKLFTKKMSEKVEGAEQILNGENTESTEKQI